jgi:hypothetical protein
VQAYAQQLIAEQEAAPWRSKLAGERAATVVQLQALPQREPTHKAERILMVYFASTQSQAKEGARMKLPWPSP